MHTQRRLHRPLDGVDVARDHRKRQQAAVEYTTPGTLENMDF
jgi:hypothetical protein